MALLTFLTVIDVLRISRILKNILHREAKENTHFFEWIYFTHLRLRSEVLHELFVHKVHQCGVAKLLIEALVLRHKTYMPALHGFHFQQNEQYEFTGYKRVR